MNFPLKYFQLFLFLKKGKCEFSGRFVKKKNQNLAFNVDFERVRSIQTINQTVHRKYFHLSLHFLVLNRR